MNVESCRIPDNSVHNECSSSCCLDRLRVAKWSNWNLMSFSPAAAVFRGRYLLRRIRTYMTNGNTAFHKYFHGWTASGVWNVSNPIVLFVSDDVHENLPVKSRPDPFRNNIFFYRAFKLHPRPTLIGLWWVMTSVHEF